MTRLDEHGNENDNGNNNGNNKQKAGLRHNAQTGSAGAPIGR